MPLLLLLTMRDNQIDRDSPDTRVADDLPRASALTAVEMFVICCKAKAGARSAS